MSRYKLAGGKTSSPPEIPDRSEKPACQRRFSPEIKRQALALLVAGGKTQREIACKFGTTPESLRNWMIAAKADGTFPSSNNGGKEPPTDAPPISPPAPEEKPSSNSTAPLDPGAGLGAHEVAAILDLKKRHPVMGPAQIRAQLKRFKGWRVSVKAIARTLRKNGYELEHIGSRPKGEREPIRFEAPHRNALWQLDFAELQIGAEHRSLLLIEDDFSRFLVAHKLLEHPTSESVVELMREAIALHGKPEAVYTDRGGQFLAWLESSSFQRFLEVELIDHHLSAAYNPRGRGKIEAAIHTVKRELWEVVHFGSVEEAERALAEFVSRYNHRRAHLGIDGLVPADRFFGRMREVKDAIEAQSRRREGALALRDQLLVIEEFPAGDRVEVLRLMAVGGELELRFLGHRVKLGRVEP
jgi:transposase InsO family protein/transposase-like protein